MATQIDNPNLWDEEIEQSLLGGLLIDPQQFHATKLILGGGGAFFLVKHRYIFDAIEHVLRVSGQLTTELLAYRLNELGQLKNIGGGAYISNLIAATPTSLYTSVYATLLSTLYQRRLLLEQSHRIAQLAQSTDIAVEDALSQSLSGIRAIAENGASPNLSIQQRYSDYLDLISSNEDKRYIPTPFPTLNETLGGGIRRGNYSIMTAPPGGNKTMLAAAWLAWATSQKWANGNPFRVLVHSIEMGAVSELMPRLMSAWTGLTIGECERPNPDSTKRIVGAYQQFVQGANCEIDDKAGVTIDEIDLRAETFKPDLLILDYAQLIKLSSSRSNMNQYESHNLIASRLKEIAKNTNCAILLLAQMNTEGSKARAGKLSQATIEGSRAWNQGASSVLILQNYKAGNGQYVGISTEKSRFSGASSANSSPVPTLEIISGTAKFRDVGLQIVPREEDSDGIY
jgi:replicative DNA helicase